MIIHSMIAIIAALLACAPTAERVAEEPVQWKKWITAARTIALFSLAASASNLILVGSFGDHVASAETLFKDNFNDGNANEWAPQGGSWAVRNGEYVGQGTTAGTPADCGLIGLAQSVIERPRASDVEVEADMRSIERVDKFIIFRSADPGNELDLDFRAERPEAFPADLSVDEFLDCQQINYLPEFSF